ncbi:LysR family transcriptional regulator [Sphingomonas koreensis]|nr:LysR family transcriptional regulator [Sphingomonas koreensis]
MDLRQLRYFVVLADELHFRRAAERLNITQAPLSVAIQTLERELGGQLFHRTQRRVELTELGATFRDHATSILARVERSVAEVREIVTGQAGQLRLGFTSASSLLSFFPHIICAFRLKYPKVRVTLRDLSSAGQIQALQHREIDVGIIRSHNAPQPADIAVTRLLQDRLVAAMHADNPLNTMKSITIADLRDVPLIFYPRQSGVGIYPHFMKSCAKHGFIPNIVQEAYDSSTIIGLAAAGLGVAVVPPELQCIAVPNVSYRPLMDDDALTELLLVSRAGEPSALIAGFKHMVQMSLAVWQRDNPDAVPKSSMQPAEPPEPTNLIEPIGQRIDGPMCD